MEADRLAAVNALLVQAQKAHARFEATELNGVYDREWPRWYAAYAVEHGIGGLLGRDVPSDRLAEFLAASYAEFEQADPKPTEPWAAYTARRITSEV